jgi:dTDP-4-dehydrorhamnose reductase
VIKHVRSNSSKDNLDITKAYDVFNYLSLIQPETIINLVALTNVDYCEANPKEAYLVNSSVVKNISDWIKDTHSHSHLIQISSDQLYDGSGINVEQIIAPSNYYSFSKYIGELEASKIESTILRVNFFGLSKTAKRISFTDFIYKALDKKDSINVFEDVFFSPLCMGSLVEMIDLVIKARPIGTYNLGSNSGMSKAQFAFHFANELGFTTDLMSPISINQMKTLQAYRPKNMMMNVEKFETTLGVKLPLLIDQITKSAKEYHELKK